ncbi:hypothetical protein AAG747_19880 [Rapidithrix thailandica]|uniref:OmpA-like domain-containing protein n=1 Tax=Rapidithrix thailandica TaxID=413964 RepID=A0AAW9SEG4_9BACT
MKKQLFLFFCFLFLIQLPVWAQVPTKILPRDINIPMCNQVFPSIRGDAKALVYMTDYTNSKRLHIQYAEKKGPESWEDPVKVKSINLLFENNYWPGYSLTYDGNYIYFTSQKYGGRGKYDIWFTEKKGTVWADPLNIGMPVNSETNDGSPSLSADGQYLYFMRCESMGYNEASGCKLFVAKRKNDWMFEEAEPLPDFINQGNCVSPKILPDGQTLIFASDKAEAGNLDLYLTKKSKEGWSEPIPIDFMNDEHDNFYVSVPARGDLIYYVKTYKEKENIVKSILPEAFRPHPMIQITGKIVDKDSDRPLKAAIRIQNLEDASQEQVIKNHSDGSYYVLIQEGAKYDFSVMALDKKHNFYAKTIDLTKDFSPKNPNWDIKLSKTQKGETFRLNTVCLSEDAHIDQASEQDLKRVFLLLKSNPSIKIEIGVHTDSVYYDTLYQTVNFEENLQAEASNDSLLLLTENTSLTDSQREMTTGETEAILADSFNQEASLPPYTVRKIDPTLEQAEKLKAFLVEKGVPENFIQAQGYGDRHKLVPNTSLENRKKNRRVEIKILH